MAAVPFFRDTNMAAVTSRENTLLNVESILKNLLLMATSFLRQLTPK